jgi:hypothetical protein
MQVLLNNLYSDSTLGFYVLGRYPVLILVRLPTIQKGGTLWFFSFVSDMWWYDVLGHDGYHPDHFQFITHQSSTLCDVV